MLTPGAWIGKNSLFPWQQKIHSLKKKFFVVCQEFHRNNRCIKTQGNVHFPPLHEFASKEINLWEEKTVSKMCALGNTDLEKEWRGEKS